MGVYRPGSTLYSLVYAVSIRRSFTSNVGEPHHITLTYRLFIRALTLICIFATLNFSWSPDCFLTMLRALHHHSSRECMQKHIHDRDTVAIGVGLYTIPLINRAASRLPSSEGLRFRGLGLSSFWTAKNILIPIVRLCNWLGSAANSSSQRSKNESGPSSAIGRFMISAISRVNCSNVFMASSLLLFGALGWIRTSIHEN